MQLLAALSVTACPEHRMRNHCRRLRRPWFRWRPSIEIAFVHNVIDDQCRTAYAETCTDETAANAIGASRGRRRGSTGTEPATPCCLGGQLPVTRLAELPRHHKYIDDSEVLGFEARTGHLRL